MIKLKELRKEKGITQNKLAHDINLARSTISMYENGLSEPNLEILIQLSKYFNVSTDCLLGLDNSIEEINLREYKINTVEKILQLIKSSGKSEYTIKKETGLPNSIFTNWKQGRNKPSAEALCKIADYFGVSVDYLMGRETPSQEPLFALLNEENRNKVNSLAESLLKTQNGTEPLKLNDELTLLINELDEQQKEQLVYFIKGMLQASTKNYIKV